MTKDHRLVMPFVTVVSRGGPHEDAAYAAGYQCGRLDVELAIMRVAGVVGSHFDMAMAQENMPQADLLAMHHGFKMHSAAEPLHGWVMLRFTYVGSGLPVVDGEE